MENCANAIWKRRYVCAWCGSAQCLNPWPCLTTHSLKAAESLGPGKVHSNAHTWEGARGWGAGASWGF